MNSGKFIISCSVKADNVGPWRDGTHSRASTVCVDHGIKTL